MTKNRAFILDFIYGRDITAFFLGGPLSDADGVSAPLNFDCPSPSLPLTDGVNGVSSLIDRFGALLIIEQVILLPWVLDMLLGSSMSCYPDFAMHITMPIYIVL